MADRWRVETSALSASSSWLMPRKALHSRNMVLNIIVSIWPSMGPLAQLFHYLRRN